MKTRRGEIRSARQNRQPEFVVRRSRVGARSVEIGLDQVSTHVAQSRLRSGLGRSLQENWEGHSTLLKMLDGTWRAMRVLLAWRVPRGGKKLA